MILIIGFLFSFSCKDQNQVLLPEVWEDNLVELTVLDSEINESSALIQTENQLWTLNDSGQDAKLFRISENSPNIVAIAWIQNAQNRDWEDLAQSEDKVFIGDFGNNGGNRMDLGIYTILKNEVSDTTPSIFTPFSFSDQVDFNHTPNQHDFNCEAMIHVDDQLFLFSKNHLNQKTKLYSLDLQQSPGLAQMINEFDVNGLITGAAIDKNAKLLCLLGYEQNNGSFAPFVWIFFDYPGNDFFDGKARRINLPISAQTEGICFKNDHTFLISSEDEPGDNSGKLFLFDAGKWKE